MWFESAQVELVRDSVPEWMAFLFAFLSYLGSVWFVAPVIIVAFWFGNRRQFAPWLGIVMGGYAIMLGLKGVFAVQRPAVGPAIAPETLPTALALLYRPAVEHGTASFPSGHAIAGTIVWTMLAIESARGTRRQRLVGAATVILLVAVARVGAGVHYPIDVVVGIGIALGYLAAILWVHRRMQVYNDHVATTLVFVVAAVLSLIAFRLSGRPDPLALFGGSLGATLVWQYARPPADPWPLSVRGVGQAVFGLVVLVAVATGLLLSNWAVGWLLVGFGGGITLVALPTLSERGSLSTLRRRLPVGR